MGARRSLAQVAVTALLLVTGCSGGSSGNDGQDQTAQSSAGDQLTVGQLAGALLVTTDLPSGWKVTKNDTDDDDDDDLGDSKCGQQLRKLEEFTVKPVAEQVRTFSVGKDEFVTLEHSVETFADADAVERQFDEIQNALRGCTSVTFSSDGMPATLSIKTVSLPRHGDDTFALRMTGKVSAFPIDLLFGVYRIGHNTSGIAYGGLGEANPETFRTAMAAAWTKLERAHTIDASTSPAAPQPSSTLKTGGPGTYTGTTDEGVKVRVELPAKPGSDALADAVLRYFAGLGSAYSNVTLALVRVENGSDEAVYADDVTVVTEDGTQLELENLVGLLNKTNDTHPSAYERAGGDLNDEASDRQLTDLKPGAKASYVVGIDKKLVGISTVYLSVGGEDLQLTLA